MIHPSQFSTRFRFNSHCDAKLIDVVSASQNDEEPPTWLNSCQMHSVPRNAAAPVMISSLDRAWPIASWVPRAPPYNHIHQPIAPSTKYTTCRDASANRRASKNTTQYVVTFARPI